MNMNTKINSIYNIIDKVITQNFYDYLPDLIETLNKYNSLFINILVNDAMNSADRNLIIDSYKNPIQIPGLPQKITLTQDFIQEAIIISDLFQLNEMTSVELLLTAEAEVASNPDIGSRGLISVLKYYMSQRTIVESLRNILQSKLVVTSGNHRATEVLNFLESYSDSLFQNGLFTKLINKLKSMNIKSEIELLENQKALGSAKHRRQFHIIFNDIKNTLAECIMLYSFKTPLTTNYSKSLIEFVRSYYLESENDIKNEESLLDNISPIKDIDRCFVYLLVSLMNSMNPLVTGLNHPLFNDDEYIRSINEILKINMSGKKNSDVKDSQMKSIVHNFNQVLCLSWIISLQKVTHLKQDKVINFGLQVTTNFGDYDDLFECDSFNFESSDIYECFCFMTQLVNVEGFHEENVWMKCFHDFVADFIIYMPKMLKDLKIESLRLKSSVTYFSSLLEFIGRLHGSPQSLCDSFTIVYNEFLESLTLEFFSPHEIICGTDMPSMLIFEENSKNWAVKSNDSYRQAALFKFIRDCGDLFGNAELFINYIFMLKGLCSSERISAYIYSLLNGNQIGNQFNKLSWNWFSNSIYQHAKFLIANPHKSQIMDPMELDGLLVVLQLIKRVATMNVKVCDAMVSNESLMLVQNMVLLLSCGIPKLLKAELLNCLAVFCQKPPVAKNIWHLVISSSPETTGQGILAELAETEPKLEEFCITRAFLNFLLAVTPYIISNSSLVHPSSLSFSDSTLTNQYAMMENLTYLIQSLMDNVFIKHSNRTYRNIEEKFSICESFLKLCCKCVELFLSKTGNTKSTRSKISWCQFDPGFYIITQLLSESSFFKTLINIIDSGYLQITEFLNNITFGPKTVRIEAVELLSNSIFLGLELISTVLKNESFLVELNSKVGSQCKNDNYSRRNFRFAKTRNFIPQELSRLLITTNCTQSFFPNLIKYIGIVDEREKIACKALVIFNHCVKLIQPHSNLLLMLINHNVIDLNILPLMVTCIDKYGDAYNSDVESLDNEQFTKHFFNDNGTDSPRTLVLNILINCLQQPTPNLGQYLVGFVCDSALSVKRTSLQEAGIGDFPKTCLHSLLNLIQRLVSELVSDPLFKDAEVPSDYLPILIGNMIDLGLAYRILYLLASNCHTSNAVLRFIRSNYQFIFNQFEILAFNTGSLKKYPELRALIWNQKSWILKIIAIELRLCTANQQRSYISKLLTFLFGEDLYLSNGKTFLNWLSNENSCNQGLIYQLLEDFDITEAEEINNLSTINCLKPEILKEYLNDCLEDTYMDIQLMNTTRLRQIIFADLNLVMDEEHMQTVHQEIDNLYQFIDKYNTNVISLNFGKLTVVEAWRQVVEVVMLSECSSEDYIDIEIKRQKIYLVLRLINEKILVSSTPNCLMTPFSRTYLILAGVLAGMFVNNNRSSRFISHVMPDDIIDDDEEKSLETVNVESLCSQLQMLIKEAVMCILEIDYKYQNTRIKFYGVITYLLQTIFKITNLRPDLVESLSNLYLIINNKNSSLVLENISEKCLYSTVCSDCVSGNIHLALSSLTVLDCLLSVDNGNRGLVTYLISHGYLNNFIDSLVRDCGNIFNNLKQSHDINYMHDTNNSNDLHSYYLYLSRMSLLCKLATTKSGATALVQSGALTNLSRSNLFKIQHSMKGNSITEHMYKDEDDLEDLNFQYRNIMSLAVQLSNNILSTFGIEKSDAVREVLVFIGEAIDSLCEIFQCTINSISTNAIKEMIHISNLFVVLVPGILKSKSQSESDYKYRTLEKIRVTSANMMVFLLGLLNKPTHNENELMLSFLQIQLMSNFLSISSGIVAPCSEESKRFFFTSHIDHAIGGKNNWNSAIRKISQSVMSGNKPPLSLLIIILYKMQECLENTQKKLMYFVSPGVNVKITDLKKSLSTIDVEENLRKMSTDQLQSLWNSVFDNMSIQQFTGDQIITNAIDYISNKSSLESDLAKDLLIVYKRINNVMNSIICSLENCCFLLWNHILSYKSSDDKEVLFNDSNIHPIQRIHIKQQFKMESDQSKSNLINEDIAVILSKCIDEEMLQKIQSSIEMYLSGEESSFSKVLIHRLIRIIKLC